MSTLTHPTPQLAGPVATRRRALLLGVAALLCAGAALAIGILLFGDFGDTEGRILTTTFLLAGHGLLALPAAVLVDRKRLLALAAACATLAVLGAALTIALVWSGGESDLLGKAAGTVVMWLVVFSQTASLVGSTYRRLFAASVAAAVGAATLMSIAIWGEVDSEGLGRAVGAIVVLDALLVALQPLLGRARRAQQLWTLRVTTAGEGRSEVTVPAASLADAAAKAIRRVEERGGRVRSLELVE